MELIPISRFTLLWVIYNFVTIHLAIQNLLVHTSFKFINGLNYISHLP